MIKKRIAMFFLVVICFILQNTILKTIELGSVAPNLLLVITAGFGFVGGRREGMFIGVICGLFADIFYGQLFGYYTLLYTLIGYANGFFHAVFYDQDIKQPYPILFLHVTSHLIRAPGRGNPLFTRPGGEQAWFFTAPASSRSPRRRPGRPRTYPAQSPPARGS